MIELSEASGYIPSEKEKNDPRYKTALTVDVKPNSIKNNAKAFNWKTSRAGIPPQARVDGKLMESVNQEDNYFMTEGCGVFAYALWIANGKPDNGDIMIISNTDGEPWFGDENSDDPTHDFEATHVYYDDPVLGPVDVKGPRPVDEMIDDFGVDATLEGPYHPIYFKHEWMGNTDEKPLWFDENTLQEALAIINSNKTLYLKS